MDRERQEQQTNPRDELYRDALDLRAKYIEQLSTIPEFGAACVAEVSSGKDVRDIHFEKIGQKVQVCPRKVGISHYLYCARTSSQERVEVILISSEQPHHGTVDRNGMFTYVRYEPDPENGQKMKLVENLNGTTEAKAKIIEEIEQNIQWLSLVDFCDQNPPVHSQS